MRKKEEEEEKEEREKQAKKVEEKKAEEKRLLDEKKAADAKKRNEDFAMQKEERDAKLKKDKSVTKPAALVTDQKVKPKVKVEKKPVDAGEVSNTVKLCFGITTEHCDCGVKDCVIF